MFDSVTNVNRAKIEVSENDIPKIHAGDQYLNKPSASKTFIFIKYETLSLRNNNKILDLKGNKGFNRARRLRLAKISHFKQGWCPTL